MESSTSQSGNKHCPLSGEGKVDDNSVTGSGISGNLTDRRGNSGELCGLDLNEGVNVILHDQGLDLNKPIPEESTGLKKQNIDVNLNVNEEFENVGGERKVRWFDLNLEWKEDEIINLDDDEEELRGEAEGDKGKGKEIENSEENPFRKPTESVLGRESSCGQDSSLNAAGIKDPTVVYPPKVELPPSSPSLDLTRVSIFDTFYVHAFLRSFSTWLLLSPFDLDDFVKCLNCNDSTSLLDNIHVALLQTLRAHLKSLPPPRDCLRSLNWDLLDIITWPVFLVKYLLLQSPRYIPGLKLSDFELFQRDYYKMPVSTKMDILRHLCDDVAQLEAFRSEMDRRTSMACMTKQQSKAGDSNGFDCYLCKRHGALMCCDGCSRAYHSRCVGIVSSLLAEGNRYCPECEIHKDKPWEKMGSSIRGAELMGVDPHGRRFYSICGYLLVSDYCNDKYSFWFYNRNDLPNLLEALESSPLLYAKIISTIYKQWDVKKCASISYDPHMNLSSKKYGYESSTTTFGGTTSVVSSGTHYVNFYELARTATLYSEELTQCQLKKSSDKSSEDATMSAEEETQMKLIKNRSAEFLWSNISSYVNLKKEKCGWCVYCEVPEDEKTCLFIMKDNFPAVENFSSAVLEIQTRETRKNHLIDIKCHIICIEDHLKGLLSGPWLEPHYSEMWRKSVLEAADLGPVKDLLLELESNLHHRALSADWTKAVDSVANVGSAFSSKKNERRVLSRDRANANNRKCSKEDITHSSKNDTGLCFLWWRGGKVSQILFNSKVLPRSLATKAARQGGCRNMPGIIYPEKGNGKRMRFTAWRAAVEQSRSVEQLALQIRELDANIRWDDIGNSQFLAKMDKKFEKHAKSFEKVIISSKRSEGNMVRYLLDFGKRRSIPEDVVRYGSSAEASSSKRKKYWLEESHVPLHLIKAFEKNKIARKSNKAILEEVHESCGVMKKPLQKKGFHYLFSKAERAEIYKCGHCNEDVPIREAVTCQDCRGFFHERHAEKSSESTSVESTYTCHKCIDGKMLTQTDAPKGKSDSSKRKKPSKEFQTLNSEKSKKLKGDKNKPEPSKDIEKITSPEPVRPSEEIEKVPSAEPLRRSGRSSERFTLLMESLKAEKRTRLKAIPEEVDLNNSNILRKKRKSVDSSYWFNGVQLSRTNNERCMQFRSNMLLVLSGDDTSIGAICSLCSEVEHKSNLNYVACQICRGWFHADALGLGADQIKNVIGFKCHQCLNKRPPICPHHCLT